ncbi:hypothetical protein L9F63_023521, partial [Diploptera punctata]
IIHKCLYQFAEIHLISYDSCYKQPFYSKFNLSFRKFSVNSTSNWHQELLQPSIHSNSARRQ